MSIEPLYRSEFPLAQTHTYLNHAAISPLPARSVGAIHEHLAQVQTVPYDLLLPGLERMDAEFRERAARLINAARPDEIVPMSGTAAGINIAATSLPLRPGDNVLVLDGDYPAVIYPWLNLAPRGILTKMVPLVDGGVDLDVLESRIDAHTRVVCVSSALFATGSRVDLAAVGDLCRRHELFLVVDAIQTLGVLPMDVQAWGIDFLACGSHKWLMGPTGSGLLYCRHELLDHLQLGPYVGAFSVVDPWNFGDYNFTLQPTSARFATSVPNALGQIALNASMGLLLDAGIENIGRHIFDLTDHLITVLDRRGVRVISSRLEERRTGITMLQLPDADASYQRLLDERVVVAVRGGNLRVSPHLYNTIAEVELAGELLAT